MEIPSMRRIQLAVAASEIQGPAYKDQTEASGAKSGPQLIASKDHSPTTTRN